MKAAISAFCLGLLILNCAAGDFLRVTPKPTTELLANPGMGWQTFHKFADDDGALAGLPSGSAYFRFYWRELEPQEGKIDFAHLDGLMARCKKAGQKLALRVMCTGSSQYMDVPVWLKEQGCKGVEFTFERGKHWVPDFTDQKFLAAHMRLIRELGARYDAHPEMGLLDIGSVGLWAEWHMSGTESVETGKAVPLPPLEIRMALIDAWASAFPHTPKVVLVGSEEGMAMTVQKGFGWRADCLGDMGGFSKTWNHMENMYRQQVDKTGAGEAWKKAPVAFESCWDMRKWVSAGWNVTKIFDYALDLHASYINNKSAPIPQGTREEIERLLRKLGYRLVLRSFEMPAASKGGSSIEAKTSWNNDGVAPPYVDHRVALRFQSRENPAADKLVVTSTSVRGWRPGPREERLTIRVPSDLTPGAYTISIGLVNSLNQPEIKMPVELPLENGWYRLGNVTLQ